MFFALDLPPLIKTHLLTLQGSFSELSATPVSSDKFHITLSYLGDVTDKQLESILDNFEPLPIEPFEIQLDKLIYWPKPAIIGVAIRDEKNKLKQCKKQIEKQLSRLNFFSYDKKLLVPHITLLRNVEPPIVDRQPLEHSLINGQMPIDRINAEQMIFEQVSLFRSMTSLQGIKYQIIEDWNLQDSSIKRRLLGY